MHLQTGVITTKPELHKAVVAEGSKPPKEREFNKASEGPNLLQFGCLSGFQYES